METGCVDAGENFHVFVIVDGLGVEGACCLKNKGRKYVTQEYRIQDSTNTY